MAPAQFVNKLNQNAGNVLSASERTTAISLFGGAADSNTTARAQAVRQVAETLPLQRRIQSRLCVSEYFGYLGATRTMRAGVNARLHGLRLLADETESIQRATSMPRWSKTFLSSIGIDKDSVGLCHKDAPYGWSIEPLVRLALAHA
jgi:hypothetical protein